MTCQFHSQLLMTTLSQSSAIIKEKYHPNLHAAGVRIGVLMAESEDEEDVSNRQAGRVRPKTKEVIGKTVELGMTQGVRRKGE